MAALLDRSFPKCEVYGTNLNLYIPDLDQCVYPDGMLICGQPEAGNDRDDIVANPTLVVEVPPPSTKPFDRVTKVPSYRQVASLKPILVLSQDRVSVEHHERINEKTWHMTEYGGGEQIEVMGAALMVSEIYKGILG
jgi:Uma2 family endonuclease